MEIIRINKLNYVLGDDVLQKAPIYCKGCRSSRDIIRKKNIDKNNFIYARKDNKTNEWTINDGKSVKIDKLLFRKKFVDEVITELNPNCDDEIKDINGVGKAPEIIELNDNEKFKDNDGNIIEIETRGDRTIDNIFFKVKDVMVGFEMDSLNDTLTKNTTNYIDNIHYKYFYCKNKITDGNKNKIKKELFLTYKGFERAIFLSKNKCLNNNTYVMKKWLDNFDKKVLNNYSVNIQDNIILNNTGYVYIVSSALLQAVKIGMWRSNIESLYSRYITYYGKDVHIDYFLTSNVRELENKIHTYFNDNRITNELFDNKRYNEYIEFIKLNIINPQQIPSEDNIIYEIDNDIINLQQTPTKDKINYEIDNESEDKIKCKINNTDNVPLNTEIYEEPVIINNNNNDIIIPEIIYIEDNEKFKNNDGNIIEIETRGDKNTCTLYFKVKDIITGFKIKNLNSIINIKNGYVKKIHYDYFNINGYETELFLTYEGILRVLFTSKSSNNRFIKWATQTLFTVQMGTPIQKTEMISNILGVNAKVIKEVFNTSTNTLPCVYLFTFGTVKDLRESMNISLNYSDDSIVAKYGMTKDLTRRTSEHINNFNKIKNCNLKLKYHSYIDPQYISQGESDLKLFMNALKLNLVYENYDELVIIPKEHNYLVERQYQQIGKNYMGHIGELITKIKDLQDKLEKIELVHKMEIQEMNHKLEMLTEKSENELLKKEIEI
jgi:hypothetical protein